jgi:hypothetical protein
MCVATRREEGVDLRLIRLVVGDAIRCPWVAAEVPWSSVSGLAALQCLSKRPIGCLNAAFAEILT